MYQKMHYGSIVFSPLLGWLTSRHPLCRSNLALAVIGFNVLGWAAALLWPGRAPWWLLILLVVAMSAGGPGTGIGFDYPRTLLPPAATAAERGFVCPEFADYPVIHIENGRHPIVEQQVRHFTANHTRLDHKHRLMLLTGPNMGYGVKFIR